MATTTEYNGTFTQVDAEGNKTILYPKVKTDKTLTQEGVPADAKAVGDALANVGGGGIPIVAAASTDGVAYTATVDGVTELEVGMKITLIPAVVSTSLTPTLNVNGLGAKYIRMPGTYNTATCVNAAVVSWLSANKPVTVTWDGTQWETDIQRPNAQSLAGAVPIENGGTGATTLDGAKEALGISNIDFSWGILNGKDLGFSATTTNRYLANSGTITTGGIGDACTAANNGVTINESGYYDIFLKILVTGASNKTMNLGVRKYIASDNYTDVTDTVIGGDNVHLYYVDLSTHLDAGVTIRPIASASASGATITTFCLKVVKRYTP